MSDRAHRDETPLDPAFLVDPKPKPDPGRVECRCGATVAAWALAERGGVCPCCGELVDPKAAP